MKYCVKFDTRFHYLNEIEEIIINYIKQKIDAIKYIREHPNQTVILFIDNKDIKIKDDIDIKQLSQIALEHPEFDFKVLFSTIDYDIENYHFNFRYFFQQYVDTWDEFLGIINLNVSDIYVGNELCFELDKISKIAHNHIVKLRCYANIAQSSWRDNNPIKKFFIRPEDVSIYDKYIDVIEFIAEAEKNNIYYQIYKYDKKWFGNLNEIIDNFDEKDEINFDSRYIIPRFAETRVKCGKKCLRGKNCKMCDRVYELSQSLSKAKLIIRKEEENKNG